MRLHVGVIGAEELLGALDGEGLDLVDDIAAAVVAPAGVTLRVLVREHGTRRLEDGLRDEVLGRDQLQVERLTPRLPPEERRDLRVRPLERRSDARPTFGSLRELVDHADTASVAAPLELAVEPGLDDGPCRVGVQAVGGQRQHVGVVVAACHLRRLDVLGERRAHSREPVRRVHDPEAGAADQDPALGLSLGDRPCGGRRKPGVVDGLLAVRPEVAHFESVRFEAFAELFLEAPSPVITGHDDGIAHPCTPPHDPTLRADGESS